MGKHLWSSINVVAVCALSFALTVVLVFPDFALAASKVKEIEQEIIDKNSKIKKLEEESDRLESKIEQAKEQERTLQNQILIFDSRIASLEVDVQRTQEQVEAKRLEIEKKRLEIDETERKIVDQKKILGDLLRRIDENDQISTLELLLGYQNFSEYLNRAEQVRALQAKSDEVLQDIKVLRDSLIAEEVILEDQERDLKELEKQQQDELSKQEAAKKSKLFLLEKTGEDAEKFKELIADNERLKVMFAEERERLQADLQRAIAEAKMTVPTATGKFMWPVTIITKLGRPSITAYFMDPSYFELFGFNHYGVDFDGDTGDPIFAAENGTVAVVGSSPNGYGNYIDILHEGGIVTRYGHLSSIGVSRGQVVLKGDVIGAMGSTGFSTGPHLHFEIRMDDGVKPVDPLPYLR